jgi:hypothetical protein
MASRSQFGFLIACLIAALLPLALSRNLATHTTHKADAFAGWPATFENQTLKQLPLSPLEQRFQQDFPGHLGRFTDGKREIILRWVDQGSRRLHPASDCFKANGYTVTPQPIRTEGTVRWSTFIATRGTERYLVSERIHDGAGKQWSDVSSWYWEAQLGKSAGPWWAVTVAQKYNRPI